MTFMIFDSDGNALGRFSERDAAASALYEMVRSDPQAADEVALFEYDAAGEVQGAATLAREVVAAYAVNRFVLSHTTKATAIMSHEQPMKFGAYYARQPRSPRVTAAPLYL